MKRFIAQIKKPQAEACKSDTPVAADLKELGHGF